MPSEATSAARAELWRSRREPCRHRGRHRSGLSAERFPVRRRSRWSRTEAAADAGAPSLEELVTAAQIEVLEVDPDDPVFGAASAAVVIVEFSDFQCPFCQQFSETLKGLKTVYGEDIRLVFKDYPLPNHMQAFKAAEAGHCANEQGNFWELHDTMFARQLELQIEDLKRYARELGLDQAAFDGCLDSGRFAETVLSDLTNGEQYGVSSTPTAFINGRVVMGDAPYDVLVEIIEEELDLAQQ